MGGIEIERKFLIDSSELPFDIEKYEKIEIFQAYISKNPTIRIRKTGKGCFLTVKSAILGAADNISRNEHEISITENEFNNLREKIDIESVPIEKTRYIVPLDCGLTAELDKYYSSLSGLYTVEVEFPNIESARAFSPPMWFSHEKTEDERYSNSSLSFFGIPRE